MFSLVIVNSKLPLYQLLLALMLFFVSITGVYASNYDDAFYGAEKKKDI